MLVKEFCSAVTQGKRRVEESAGGAASARKKTVVHAAGFYICIYDRFYTVQFVNTIAIGHSLCLQVK